MTRPRDLARSYWVVIPAYNEAETVLDVAMRVRQQCANVVVVDDGSTDSTFRAVAGLDVTVLHNEENCGKAGSLSRGFEHALAHGAIGVITLDADGQHAPEEIPSFVKQSLDDPNAFLIGARRRDQRRASFWRYVANRIADFWIGWAAGQPIEDSQSGFRLYPAELLREVTLKHDRSRSFVFESEIVIEAARRGWHVEMSRHGRRHDQGHVPAISGPCWILCVSRGWWGGNYSREECIRQDSIERSQVRAFAETDARVANGRLRSSGDELGTDCVVEILYPAIVVFVNFTSFLS